MCYCTISMWSSCFTIVCKFMYAIMWSVNLTCGPGNFLRQLLRLVFSSSLLIWTKFNKRAKRHVPLAVFSQLEENSEITKISLRHIRLAGSKSSRANHSTLSNGHLITPHISAGLLYIVCDIFQINHSFRIKHLAAMAVLSHLSSICIIKCYSFVIILF